MKRLVILVLSVVVFSATSFAGGRAVLFVMAEWIPFTSEALPEYGPVAELVSAVCHAGGIQPVYKFYPQKRAEMVVRVGKAFAIFPSVITEERKADYDFSDILFYGVNSFMYSTKNPKIPKPFYYDSLDALQGYRIGGMRGSFWEPAFEEAGLYYEATGSVDLSVRKLAMGRIDLLIDNQVVLYDAVRRLYPNDIETFKVLPQPFGGKVPNALMVSRTFSGAKALLKQFNEGLKILKQNGEYDRIIEKYKMTK